MMETELWCYGALWDEDKNELILTINGEYATFLNQNNISEFLDCIEACCDFEGHDLDVSPVLQCYNLREFGDDEYHIQPSDVIYSKGLTALTLTSAKDEWRGFRSWLYDLGYLDWLVF